MTVKSLEKEAERGHFNYCHINPYLMTYIIGPLIRKITIYIQVFFDLPSTENFTVCIIRPAAILNRVGLRIGKSYHCFFSSPAVKNKVRFNTVKFPFLLIHIIEWQGKIKTKFSA